MPYTNKSQPGSYEVEKHGSADVLKVNCHGYPYLPSIEDSAIGMARVIDNLIEVPSAQKIVLIDRRNYEYDYENTRMLMEIANLYRYLVKDKKLFSLGIQQDSFKTNVQSLIINVLKSDPIGVYVELKRLIRDEKVKIENTEISTEMNLRTGYIELMTKLLKLLENTKLISSARPYLAGHEFGSREIYKQIIKPSVTPDFMFTRLMASPPLHSDEIDAYSLGRIEVNIFKIPEQIQYLYHVTPPEFKLSEDKYELLDIAKKALSEHKPEKNEFIDPERMRQTFYNIGKDLIQELSESKGIQLKYKEINELAEILVRYTVGFGLIEILLEDPKIQDITINGPIGESPIFIVHEDYHECVTNLYPDKEDGESWASKFRILSGRPLDEANPVLDTELVLPKARARVAIMSKPLNPVGLAFAFRRHRDQPWTYPLFIKNKMLSPLAAGLLSFLVDGNRTLLFAGTRSSGKSSLLGSTLIEIMRKYRILSVEDTEELPVDALRKLNYNIQPMKVKSALTKTSAEMEAGEGIRTSLRFGDSALIVGEIRSSEAKALFEAMRIGALSNVVAGTIHGADPYGVFDRIVNDLDVPRTSFKATDIIIVSNPIRTADGLHKQRRILSISEVRKHWEKDPIREKGFVDLMKYNSKTDMLEPTQDLINGDSEIIKDIAGNVKEWVGNWQAVWENILMREKIKETLVNYAIKLNQNEILEAKFVVESNDMFHRISDSIREELGYLDSKRIYFEWNEWVKRTLKKSMI